MTRCWLSSGRARRAEGTTPSQGGRGRSLNQIEGTPSARIRSVRSVMSASVMCESWASSVVADVLADRDRVVVEGAKLVGVEDGVAVVITQAEGPGSHAVS